MNRFRLRMLIGLLVAVALAWGGSPDLRAAAKAAAKATAATTTATTATTAAAAPAAPQKKQAATTLTVQDKLAKKANKIMPSDKKAAAKRNAALGLKPGVAGMTSVAGVTNVGIAAAVAPPPPLNGINQGPGGVAHYFGPYANYANSPLPSGPIAAITLDSPGTGYIDALVTIGDVYGTGSGASAATATLGAGGAIASIGGGVGGTGYTAPIVTIVDNPLLCGAALQPACGTGAGATATLDPLNLTGGIRKFIDKVPGLTPAGPNGLGQYLQVAVADTTAYPAVGGTAPKPAADYYEIALVEFSEKMHTDLPATKLRGYVQLETPGTLAAMAAMVPPVITKHVSVGGALFAIDNSPLPGADHRSH